MRRWLPMLLLACVPPGGGTSDTPSTLPDLPPPAIQQVALACDLESGAWGVEVRTDAWAGGATLLWTLDGAYVEQHTNFRSVRASRDGSRDVLQAGIGIVTDFRPAANGSTAFSCLTDPSVKVWVRDLEGRVSDCRRGGPAPRLLDGIPGVPACPERYDDREPEDTAVDTSDTGAPDTGDTAD